MIEAERAKCTTKSQLKRAVLGGRKGDWRLWRLHRGFFRRETADDAFTIDVDAYVERGTSNVRRDCEICCNEDLLCLGCRDCGVKMCESCFEQVTRDKVQPRCPCGGVLATWQVARAFGERYLNEKFKRTLCEKLVTQAEAKIKRRARQIRLVLKRRSLLLKATQKHNLYIENLKRVNSSIIAAHSSWIATVFEKVELLKFAECSLASGLAELMRVDLEVSAAELVRLLHKAFCRMRARLRS